MKSDFFMNKLYLRCVYFGKRFMHPSYDTGYLVDGDTTLGPSKERPLESTSRSDLCIRITDAANQTSFYCNDA